MNGELGSHDNPVDISINVAAGFEYIHFDPPLEIPSDGHLWFRFGAFTVHFELDDAEPVHCLAHPTTRPTLDPDPSTIPTTPMSAVIQPQEEQPVGEIPETSFSTRQEWHRSGVFTDGRVLTAAEALKLAGMDWDVIHAPLYALTPDGQRIEITNRMMVMREREAIEAGDGPGTQWDPLDIVSDEHRLVTNRDSFSFLDSLVDSGDAKYSSAGVLGGGRDIYITMEIPRSLSIAGDDYELFLSLVNNHVAQRKLTGIISPVRIRCRNTMELALANAKARWSFAHTGDLDTKIGEAREALGLAFKYVDEFETIGDQLAHAAMELAEFEKLVKQLVPGNAPGDERDRMALIGTLETSPTIGDDLRRTKWGAVNAVTEYFQWIRPVRATKGKTEMDQRIESTLFGVAQKMSTKAMTLLTA